MIVSDDDFVRMITGEIPVPTKAGSKADTDTSTALGADTVSGHSFDPATRTWTSHEVPVREVLWLETGYRHDVPCRHVFAWFDRTDPDAPVVRELACNAGAVEKLLGVVPLRNLTMTIDGRGARASDGRRIDRWLVVEGGATAIAVARPAGNAPVGTPMKILEVVDHFNGEAVAGFNLRANVFQAEEDRLALEALERAKAAAKVVSIDTARLARQVVNAVDAATKAPDTSVGDGDTA